jgi:hypothetical protein
MVRCGRTSSRASADLGVLARNNGGVLPGSRGSTRRSKARRRPRHTARGTCPSRGAEYRLRPARHYGDVPYDPESFVRGRILALIDYIARMQVR